VSLALGRLLRFGDPPDPENAISFFMAALGAQPDFALAKQSLAVCLVRVGRTEEGAFTAIDLLENHPDATWIADYAVDYLTPLWRSGDRESTRNVFEAAAARDPDTPEFKAGLMIHLINGPPEHRNPSRAYAMAQELLENPERMESWEQRMCWATLAACHSWNGRDQEALTALDKMYLAEEGDDGGAWYLHAILLSRNGRQAEGRPFFDRAQEQYDAWVPNERRTDPLYLEYRSEARRLYRD
jgi:tetratricopeptide (TPR) repeat protein